MERNQAIIAQENTSERYLTLEQIQYVFLPCCDDGSRYSPNMKLLPIFATAAVCLGIGVIIGRVSSPQENASDIQEKSAKDTRERYRSARRSTTGYDDARRVGKIGGEPPVSYENRLKHMAALAKDVGGNRGIPNFDSLFGIWETAGMLDAVEILQALTDLEDSSLGQEEGMYVKAMLVMQWAKKNGPEAMDYAGVAQILRLPIPGIRRIRSS